MNQQDSGQFISLQDAANYCAYTQEYLSLRARQKKLRAVKLGRNWFTTAEWLKDYIASAESYKKRIVANRKIRERTHVETIKKVPAPPENLPIEEFVEEPISGLPFSIPKVSLAETFRLAAAFAVVIVLLGFTSVLSRDALQSVSQDLEPIVEQTTASATPYMPQFRGDLAQNFTASTENLGTAYMQWLGKNFSGITKGFVQGIQSVHQSIAQGIRSLGERFGQRFASEDPEPLQEIPIPKSEKKGLVVVPSTDENAQVKEQVTRSFSDEVFVTPQDDESGIITPVFREREGNEYFYILVPLHENQ